MVRLVPLTIRARRLGRLAIQVGKSIGKLRRVKRFNVRSWPISTGREKVVLS